MIQKPFRIRNSAVFAFIIYFVLYWTFVSQCDLSRSFAAEQDPLATDLPPEDFTWLEMSLQKADSILNEKELFIFEGKLALIDLQNLRKYKTQILKKGTDDQKQRYLRLEKNLINILRRVEMGILSTYTLDDWAMMRNEYEQERAQLVDEAAGLNDSLIDDYYSMLNSPENLALMEKLESDYNIKAGFTYRLGVLYLLQTERRYDEEILAWDELIDEMGLMPVAELPPEPQKNLGKAENQFNIVLNDYHDSEYADDASYNLIYIKSHNKETAVQTLLAERLQDFVRKYSESPYYPEVQMRLAEYYFNPPVSDITEAIQHYKIVTQYPDSPYYENALYRLGWSYYAERDFNEAVRYFSQTIDHSIEDLEANRYSTLMDESIDKLSESFTADTLLALTAIDSAVEYIKGDPKRLEFFGDRLLNRMGDIYQNDLGYYNQAVEAYDTYLSLYPYNPSAPQVSEKIIKIYDNLDDKDRVFEEKYEFFRTYIRGGEWSKAQDDSTAKTANLLAEMHLRDIVRMSVVDASNSKMSEDFRRAAELCSTYVANFPNTSETYRINYNLAVIYRSELKDYIRGCRENLKVTRKYPAGKYHEQCAVNAVDCAFQMIEQMNAGVQLNIPPAAEVASAVPPGVIAQIPYLGGNPLARAEILYLISIQNYLNLFPKGAQADLYMLSAGGLYYNHEKYQASRHYLNLLISEFPASSRIEKSKQFILQGYYQEKDFRSAENYARQLSQENISSDLRQFAQAKISESIYSYAEVLEKNQNHISAGSEFKRAALTMTKPENISNTLWKSARQFHEAAAWDSAVVSYELIVQKTPNSNWADKALYNKAFIYQDSLKDRSNAAATFERLADSYPNSEYAKIALNNARVNFIELGNYDSALKVSEKYLRLYPNTPDAVAILYEDAELYLRMNRLDKAVAAYSSFTQRFPDDPRNVQAHYQVGKYHLDKGDKVSAENSIRKTVEAHRGLLEKGQTGFPKYASFALDYLLKQKMDRFLALEYKPFSAIQQKRIAKQNLKRELDQGYNELISYGQKEAIEAFYNICRLDEDIAKAELDRDVPQADIEQRMLNREEILARALELYLTAAASFNSAKYTVAEWERNLRNNYDENTKKLNSLNQYAVSTGILPPDSLIKKQNLQDGLKEIEESIALAADVQRLCNEKIAAIYLDDARYVHQNINTLLDIPDKGQQRAEKMYSRTILLSQGYMPRAMTVFDLYLQAHSVMDTIAVSPAWKDSVVTGADELTDTIFVQYNEVIGRALSRYEINLTSFRQRLNDGDFSAIDIMGAPQRYLGFGNEFIDSLFINIDDVMRWAHGSQKIIPVTHHLDSLYTASAKYYIDYYYGIPEKNKEYYADFNRKFDETADDLFLDGLDLLEMINDDVDLYLYNLLEYAVERIEAYAVVNDDGDWILREIVKHSPGEYGYLVGLAAAGEKIISGIEWKVSPSADEDYKYAEYDDSGWMNAALVIRKHPPPPVTPVPSVSTDTSAVTIDSTAAVSDSAIIITDTTIQISSAEDSLEIPMGEEIAVAPAAPEFDYSALDEMGAPAIWLAQPAEKAYFRYLFNIPGKPISGRVSLSADENYVIFINGEFVGEDGEDESDWETPDNYSALSFLRNGQNIIAVKASDPDLTAHGFWLKLEYSVMPESIDNLPIVREPRGD